MLEKADSSKNFTYEMCEFLGKNNTKNHTEIKEFLRTFDSKILIKAQENLSTKYVRKHLIRKNSN